MILSYSRLWCVVIKVPQAFTLQILLYLLFRRIKHTDWYEVHVCTQSTQMQVTNNGFWLLCSQLQVVQRGRFWGGATAVRPGLRSLEEVSTSSFAVKSSVQNLVPFRKLYDISLLNRGTPTGKLFHLVRTLRLCC